MNRSINLALLPFQRLLYFVGILAWGFTVQINAQTTYQWDTNGSTTGLGGTGNWNTTDSNWDLFGTAPDDGTATTIAFPSANSSIATFGGTAGTVTLNGALTARRAEFTVNGYTLNGSSILTLNNAATTSAGGALAAVGVGVTVTIDTQLNNNGTTQIWAGGGGKIILNNTANAFSNGLVLAGSSTLEFSNQAALGLTGATNSKFFFNTNGGSTNTLRYTGTSDITFSSTQFDTFLLASGSGSNSRFDVANSGKVTISSVVTNNGGSSVGFTKLGTGTLILSNANTYTGTTIVNEGILQLSGGNNRINTTNTVTVGGVAAGATFDLNGQNQTLANLNLGTGSTAGAFAGTVTTGVGTLTLTGNLATANINITNSHSITGNLDLGGAARTMTVVNGGNAIDLSISAVVSNGGITKAGAGTLALGASNAFTGGLTINHGEVLIQNAGALNSSTPNAVIFGTATNNKNLTLSGNSVTIASLEGGEATNTNVRNNLAATTATLTIDKASGTATYAGILNNGGGTLALTKTGAGTQVFTNANTYTGATNVNNGTLEVNNTSGSGTGTGTVTIANTATLKGDGAITTAANNFINLNGTLQVGQTGATVGQDLSLTTSGTGSTVFGASSILGIDLWSTTGTDMSGSLAAADMLRLFGDLDITAGSSLLFGNPNMLTFQSGDVFKVLDLAGAGAVSGNFSVDLSAATLGAGLSWNTADLYTLGTISVMTIPEPSRTLFLLIGLVGLALRLQRQR